MKREEAGRLDWLRTELIIAATDFTPVASAAARRAAELAATRRARLALLHVVSPVGRMAAPVLQALGVRGRPTPGEALDRLARLAARLKMQSRLKVETHLASGNPADGIAAHAHKADADLIVVGNRQGGFLVDLLRINTAHRVRRRLAVPVLAVSQPAEHAYRGVLLATDLSPDSAHAGRVARRLFPSQPLHLLHVCQPPYEGTLAFAGVERAALEDYRRRELDDARQQLEKFARDAYLAFDAELEVRLGDPAAQIRRYVSEEAIDIVVLCPAKSWLARGMANSVTEQLLADPPCDALLVG